MKLQGIDLIILYFALQVKLPRLEVVKFSQFQQGGSGILKQILRVSHPLVFSKSDLGGDGRDGGVPSRAACNGRVVAVPQ